MSCLLAVALADTVSMTGADGCDIRSDQHGPKHVRAEDRDSHQVRGTDLVRQRRRSSRYAMLCAWRTWRNVDYSSVYRRGQIKAWSPDSLCVESKEFLKLWARFTVAKKATFKWSCFQTSRRFDCIEMELDRRDIQGRHDAHKDIKALICRKQIHRLEQLEK